MIGRSHLPVAGLLALALTSGSYAAEPKADADVPEHLRPVRRRHNTPQPEPFTPGPQKENRAFRRQQEREAKKRGGAS